MSSDRFRLCALGFRTDAFFAAGYVWGALAVWFVQPSWIGAGISSVFIVWAYTYTLSKRRSSGARAQMSVQTAFVNLF